MILQNLTPHAIVLNDGATYPPSGDVARVSMTHTQTGDIDGTPVFGTVYGSVTGLPAPQHGTIYIVSAMVLAASSDRDDLVAPATGHPDVVRNDKGQIVSVPGWVK
jgi:hypothetical protein